MSTNNPMSFYSENVDAWGPLEWFDRLAKAVHARSQAVRDKDDIAFETYKNIASSSATRLVSDFEDKVRMALTTLRELEKANVAYVEANTELLTTLDVAHAEENRLRTIALDMQAGYREATARAEAAEAEVRRLQAEIDRKSSMPGDHRYWEGRYRDEAAHNDKLREALKPFGKVGAVIDGPFGPALFAENDMAFQSGCAWSENGERKTLTWGDFRRARTALASTGGEHHAE